MSEVSNRPCDKRGLRAALESGEPLADFTFSFSDGLDYTALTERLNCLGDDLFVHTRPWYTPNMRKGVATRAALKREFGWGLKRSPCPSVGYWWEVITEACKFPAGLAGSISGLGLSQPGGDDLGQPWTYDDP